MKKILFLILIIFIAGCGTGAVLLSEPSISLTTDKELYHSGEVIHITSEINSPAELNNVSVRFYGIYSGRYRLDQTKTIDLDKGENVVVLDYNAPRCYGCAGISPGIYQITADVIYNGETLLTASKDVEIRQ